jgi:hypothetical protein
LPKVSEAAKLFAALLSPRVPDNFENQPGVDLFFLFLIINAKAK